MYHGTRFDVYWRLDRTLCYLFLLPFFIIELLERAGTHLQEILLLGVYAAFVAVFATSDDAFDTAGDAVSYTIVGLYTVYAVYVHHDQPVRLLYIAIGFAILFVSFLLLRVLDFCHDNNPWLGNLAIGHLVTVPGSTLLLASSFLPVPDAEANVPSIISLEQKRKLVF